MAVSISSEEARGGHRSQSGDGDAAPKIATPAASLAVLHSAPHGSDREE
jgi:hypothetical protein